MKDHTITFLVLTLVTGISGFALGDFIGIEFLRIMFVVFNISVSPSLFIFKNSLER